MQRWNLNYLRRLHSKYINLANKRNDPTLSLQYESTANSILDIIDRYRELTHTGCSGFSGMELSNYRELVSSDFKIISDYIDYLPYIHSLGEELENIIINPNLQLPFLKSDLGQIILISKRFYNLFGDWVSKEFNQMSKHFSDTIHFHKLSGASMTFGQTYSVYKTNKTFFELGYNNTLQDYISAIHEFGHGISCRINPNSMWDFGKYCFIELDSLFFELLGTDFVGEKLNRRKEAFDINMHILKDYMYSAMLISTKINMYSLCDRADLNSKRFTKQYLSREIGLNKQGVSDVTSTYIRDCMHYVISYLTAIELYLIYHSNPNKALDILFKIINSNLNNSREYLQYIKSLGIEPGKNFNSYIELLLERSKELNDEKSLRYKN